MMQPTQCSQPSDLPELSEGLLSFLKEALYVLTGDSKGLFRNMKICPKVKSDF